MKTSTRTNLIALAVLLLAFISLRPRALAQGTAFTYQGRLNVNGAPVGGSYDMQFTLFATNPGGVAIAGPVSNSAVAVTNGLFTTTVDFGPGVLTGTNDWLDIAVRTNGGNAFTELTPRQQLTPAPYAIFAEGADAAGISGTLPAGNLSGTYSNVVNFNNGADTFEGTFVGQFYGPTFIGGDFSGSHFGDGSGLFNLSASQLNSGTVPAAALNNAWRTVGNAGTTAGVNFVGTTDNQPLELRANGQRVMRYVPDSSTNNSPDIIGGAPVNIVAPGLYGVTISGGGAVIFGGRPATNVALGDFNTIGGGYGNTTGSTNGDVTEATIAGGAFNTASGITSAIGGGADNVAYGNNATVAGGLQNRANYHAFVGSGFANSADGITSVISGGHQNTNGGDYSFIGGGYLNNVAGPLSLAGGGENNFIGGLADHAVIGGGGGNIIVGSDALPVYCTVGGGQNNTIQTNISYATIAGGVANVIQTNAHTASIGGGTNNVIQTNNPGATIAGGWQNTIQPNAPYAVVGGGLSNTNGGFASTIGGGQGNNTLGADGAVMAGGYFNAVGSTAATVGGGQNNFIGTDADHATISGGGGNTIIGSFALPVFGAIGGGQNNTITTNTPYGVIAGGGQNTNSGNYASVGGGFNNTVSNLAATIPGGYRNIASGNISFAAGEFAQATNNGSFVWSDASGQATASTNDNSVTVRASGGFRFLTSSANPSPGVYLAPFATSWTALSDRNAKKNFAPVNTRAVLEKLASVPIEQWNYKWEADNATPNIGPMAQDFKTAFYPGRDDKGISTLEFDGVALAAIQGLNEKVESGKLKAKTEIEELKTENAELRARLEKLEQLVNSGQWVRK